MQIIVRGKSYERLSIDTCAPLHMMELQRQSKPFVDGGGLSTSTLRKIDDAGRTYARARARWVTARAAWLEAGAGLEGPELEAHLEREPVQPDEPDDLWASIATVVFLSIRGAGEPITFEAAASIPLGAIAFVTDAGDETADEDDAGDADDADDEDPSSPATGGPVTSAAGASPVTETAASRGPSSGPVTP